MLCSTASPVNEPPLLMTHLLLRITRKISGERTYYCMWIADNRKLLSSNSQIFDFVGSDNGPSVLKTMLQMSFLKTKTLGWFHFLICRPWYVWNLHSTYVVFSSSYLIFLFLSVLFLWIPGVIGFYLSMCWVMWYVKSHTVTDLPV